MPSGCAAAAECSLIITRSQCYQQPKHTHVDGYNLPPVLFSCLPTPAQGQFKQPDVQFDSLMLGSDFVRPLKLPARALLSQAIQWVANKLGGGVSVNVDAKQPYILAPLIAAAQVVHVAQPGQQLDLRAPHEDMRLYDPRLGNLWTGRF